ncbi:SH3 domain-binding protein 4 [Tupaia chinensis]|uniref:SH3 domain-binding protein 4 n=1 Tax=Tupaia chinensis TaxID=246437 RepID=L9LCQ3_TUPCH|nr:SH3 domain-binding protein 4 [Tupaia chinensis]
MFRLEKQFVPSPSALLADSPTPFGNAKEVIAIRDYCPTNFTTLKFSKGDHLYVLDTSGGEWWYAHNTTEMGYIPSSHVQPLNYRNSTLSDSGMIDPLPDSPDEVAKELELLGGWADDGKGLGKTHSNNPFWNGVQTNPFLNGSLSAAPGVDEPSARRTVDLLLFDAGTASFMESSSATANSTGNIFDDLPTTNGLHAEQPVRRDNPFFRSKRSYSLSELSVLQAKSDAPAASNFFTGLKSPAPEQFQSREDFRTAWLNHRKLARSCHDLDLLGQNPGWGQTQAVETNIVCKLDSSGGAVQLPDTSISILVPEGHVAPGETQQISMKALLDPPLELNSDKASCVSPLLEVKLSTLEVRTFLILEMKVSAEVKNDALSKSTVGLQCLRSDSKEGPYVPMPLTYSYGDTVQVQLDHLEPCMYLAIVAHGPSILYPSTVWDFIHKKVTWGRPLAFFCRAEPDSEPERVASVLEKLKEDCNNAENKDRKSFQKELVMSHPQPSVEWLLCPSPSRWALAVLPLSEQLLVCCGLAVVPQGKALARGELSATREALLLLLSTKQLFVFSLWHVGFLVDTLSCLASSSIIPGGPVRFPGPCLGPHLSPASPSLPTGAHPPESLQRVVRPGKGHHLSVSPVGERLGELSSALLKMDCQGLVVRLIQDFVLLTTAVEVAQRWRELAEKLAKVSRQQMDAYESPHRDRNGVVDSEAMWKPAYDFLLTWSHQIGDSYRDVIQELHTGLDKMKNPITKRWKHLTGTLILVNSLDVLRAAAFSPADHDDFVI